MSHRLVVFIFSLLVFAVQGEISANEVDFNFDIRPILSDRCYVCHGPDSENREADLRLDQPDFLSKESESGNVEKIVSPRDSKQSELWLRISSNDPDVVMPPPDSNLSLTAEETETIRKWIEQGASHKEHWSFLPISSDEQAANLDEFIETKLKAKGLELSSQAPREQLIRRLCFDITGLPPTTKEVDDFTSSSGEAAYEQLVDTLLSSERYGERMASMWLDVARYSDTYGYQVDRDRFVWPYRDWVIRAFNDNLPYDQFITEQLAGDLLPDATDDQIQATTFNRLHPQKVEGGSVPEEFRIEYVADRTQTFATSILGLTLECARCHDHKYDPILQKEYYQLTAFFDQIDEAGLYSYFTPSVPTPTLMLDSDGAKSGLVTMHAKVVREETVLDELRRKLEAELEPATSEATQLEIKPIEHLDFEVIKLSGKNKAVTGVVGKAVELSGDDAVNLKTGNFHRYEPFSIGLWLKMPAKRERAVVFHRSRAWTDAGSRGYQLLIEDGRLSVSLIHFWPGNAIRVRSQDEFPVNEWHHIALTYDGSSRASGLRLYVDGEAIAQEVVRDQLTRQITGGGNDHITIGERFRDIGLSKGQVDEFKVFDRELSLAQVRRVFDDEFDSPSSQEGQQIAVLNDDRYQKQLGAVKDARKAEADLLDKLQEIMVMREIAQPRDTYLLGRGAYDNRTEKVSAATPSALPAMGETLPRNRLGLARRLAHPDHPLTARVAVNRVWQLVFGEGLVRTPEDFGSQGQLPTHPELLDWLARDFIDHGWDMKRLVKQIVMSKTYRQSSVATRQLLERDPENRLYGRSPSYRWPAEMLRDQALAVSNLLVEKIGGAPVKPYELQESFKPMKPDEGEGLYRRSVYTFWKRTGPAPVMMALDAAKRDVCRVKRSRTSSPLQTLVLMNSPQFVEAARVLAERVSQKHSDPPEQVSRIFRILSSRKPTSDEQQILERLYQQQLALFEEDESEMDAYLNIGRRKHSNQIDKKQLAALTAVANTLFGLDESMMKR